MYKGAYRIMYLLYYIELEWMLGQTDAVPTKIKEDPRPKTRDVLFSSLKYRNYDDNCNDW